MRFLYLPIFTAGVFSTVAFASPCQVDQILAGLGHFTNYHNVDERLMRASQIRKSVMSVIEDETMVCTADQLDALNQLIDNHIYVVKHFGMDLEKEQEKEKSEESKIDDSKNGGDPSSEEQKDQSPKSQQPVPKNTVPGLVKEWKDMIDFRIEAAEASWKRVADPELKEILPGIVDDIYQSDKSISSCRKLKLNDNLLNYFYMNKLLMAVRAFENADESIRRIEEEDSLGLSMINIAGKMYGLVYLRRQANAVVNQLEYWVRINQQPILERHFPYRDDPSVMWSAHHDDYLWVTLIHLNRALGLPQQHNRNREKLWVVAFEPILKEAKRIGEKLAIWAKKSGKPELKTKLSELKILTQQLNSRVEEWKNEGKVGYMPGMARLLRGTAAEKGM